MREKIDTVSQPAMQNDMLSKSILQNDFKVFTHKLTGFLKYIKHSSKQRGFAAFFFNPINQNLLLAHAMKAMFRIVEGLG